MYLLSFMSRRWSVGIAVRLDDPKIEVRFSAGGVTVRRSVRTGPRSHTASYLTESGALFLGKRSGPTSQLDEVTQLGMYGGILSFLPYVLLA
jgi:hypothetical protein